MYVFDSGRVGCVDDEWWRGLDMGFTNPVETGGVWDVYLCLGYGSVGGIGGEWVGAWARVWIGGLVYVCVFCEPGLFV